LPSEDAYWKGCMYHLRKTLLIYGIPRAWQQKEKVEVNIQSTLTFLLLRRHLVEVFGTLQNFHETRPADTFSAAVAVIT